MYLLSEKKDITLVNSKQCQKYALFVLDTAINVRVSGKDFVELKPQQNHFIPLFLLLRYVGM